MRTLVLVATLGLLAAPLGAQVGPDPESLRAQVMQRFMQNFRTQAGLTDDQYRQLDGVVRRQWQARRALQEEERGIVEALGGQLRPGIAADRDSVSRLLDGLDQVQRRRIEQMQTERQEVKAFLDPVQQAQLVLAFARLEQQVQELIRQRANPNGAARRPN